MYFADRWDYKKIVVRFKYELKKIVFNKLWSVGYWENQYGGSYVFKSL